MTAKRVIGAVVIVVLVMAALAYHFLIGYVEFTRIDEKITVLTRKNVAKQIGGNVVVYSNDQATIVVDTQLPPLASSTISSIEALGNTPITAVLITHWHPDHSGGIAAFSEATNVIAHENVLKRLSKAQEGFGLTKPGSHHEFAARSAAGLPNRSLTSHMNLQAGRESVNVVHYAAAHTDGDVVVFFRQSQVAVIGDLIWPESFPYIDVHNGGSTAGLKSALEALIAASTPEYRFIPGHGGPMVIDDVETYLDMVSASSLWIENRLNQEQSVDEIIALGLPEKWKKWSSSLVPTSAWIAIVHASWRNSEVQSN